MMRKTTSLLLIFLMAFCYCAWAADKNAERNEVKNIVQTWLSAYRTKGIPDKDECKLVDLSINKSSKVITITADEVFSSQPFTQEVVSNIYSSLKDALGDKYSAYKLRVCTKKYPIEALVPFSSESYGRRAFNAQYTGAPWVTNLSRPYHFKYGLAGRHLVVWASHGLFWQTKTTFEKPTPRWEWQRPYLYTTVEDMLTPGIANQLLIPMLEHAGAIVFTPRERDWQNHEAIADNDTEGYSEFGSWHEAGVGFGFAMGRTLYHGDNPFTMGTARSCATTRDETKASRVVWHPNVPADGSYAVYVSYPTLSNSVSDAHYMVRHAGVETSFSVNQRMGGGTWVYLGHFFFSKGDPENNCVILTNVSNNQGVVAADAVRLGGGMGNIDRGGGISGMSRYFEAARYSMQWAGMPVSVYSDKGSDYSDDINVRSLATNYVSGGSVFNPNEAGLRVPLELALAVHTDAGQTPNKVHGTLGVVMTSHNDGRVAEGASRLTSHDMAQIVMGQVYDDIQSLYGKWSMRQLWDRNYSECRLPQVPSMILEMLSHQSLADMRYMHDPTFKFTLARAIYKGVLRYLSRMHGNLSPIVQPLPITRLAAQTKASKQEIRVTWQPTRDALEPTATPTGYVVYVRRDGSDFDNGIYTSVPELVITAEPGVLYSFRVAAVNAGGESMPSETVCAKIQSRAHSDVLIVDGFQRLAGPQPVSGGFDINTDPGVAYIATPSIAGVQTDFYTEVPEKNGSGELEGRIVIGNTRDIAVQHARAMTLDKRINISSCTRSAVDAGDVSFSPYRLVDLAMGLQKADGYSLEQTPVFTPVLMRELSACTSRGNSVLISGAYIGKAEQQDADAKTNILSPSIADLLKYTYISSLSSDQLANVNGMKVTSSLYQPFDIRGLGVPSVDVLYPNGGSFACMLYEPSHTTAATAYAGGDYRAVALGFPLEAMTESKHREQIMFNFLHFLIK